MGFKGATHLSLVHGLHSLSQLQVIMSVVLVSMTDAVKPEILQMFLNHTSVRDAFGKLGC